MSNFAAVERELSRKPDIEPTLPLINIVFLLLIFFLVAGTFQSPSLKSITTPDQAIVFEDIEFQPSEWIYVEGNGSLTFSDQPLALENISIAIKNGRAVLFADRTLKGASLTPILEALERTDGEGILLITKQEGAS